MTAAQSSTVDVLAEVTVSAPGRRLRLWHREPTTGKAARPVLLLHGAAYSTLAVFHDPGIDNSYSLLAALAERGLDPYGLDFTGYGGSRAGDLVPEGLDWFVADAAAAARHVRARTGQVPVVLGWSWGAQVAAALAGTDAVSGLVFWGGVWGVDPRQVPPALRSLPRPAGPWRTNTWEHAVSDFRTDGVYDPRVRAAVGRRSLEVDPRSPAAARSVFIAGLPLFDPARIRYPALLVHGEHDPLVSRADHEALARAVAGPRVEYQVVAGADHNIQFDRARGRFADLLAEFCQERS
jgi:pimeloyl-ACP methyl ester carboxylesterase